MGKLPKAVEEAKRKSEELVNEQKEHLDAFETEQAELPIEDTDGNPIEDVEETLEAAELSTEEEPEVETETEDEPEPEPAEPEIDWQHKYAVLQGKYNAEMPKLQKQVSNLASELDKRKTVAPAVEAEITPSINPKDYEEYGDEFVKLANIIQEQANQLANNNNRIESLSNTQEDIKEQQVSSDVGLFYAKLTELCPSWEKINVDPGFLTWLASAGDSFSGKTKQEHLDDATLSGNAVLVGNIFNTFKKESYKPAGKNRPAPTLDEQVTPKTTTQAPPSAKAKKQWTSAGIKQFYSDKANGKYQHDPKLAKTLENDLFLAQREGRISI